MTLNQKLEASREIRQWLGIVVSAALIDISVNDGKITEAVIDGVAKGYNNTKKFVTRNAKKIDNVIKTKFKKVEA